MRTEKQPDGSYRVFNRECAFYTDPRTGEFLDEWKNPYTKEICEVSPIHNLTVNAHLIVDSKVGTAIEMDFDGTLMAVPLPLQWNSVDDTLMSTFEVHTAFPNELDPETWPRESAGKVIRIAEIFQRVASVAEVENQDLTSAHYAGVWTRVGPWLPWMRQGQADGQLIYRTFMAKNGTIDKLPADLVARAEERLPDFFQAPPPESWGSKERFELQRLRCRERSAAAAVRRGSSLFSRSVYRATVTGRAPARPVRRVRTRRGSAPD